MADLGSVQAAQGKVKWLSLGLCKLVRVGLFG